MKNKEEALDVCRFTGFKSRSGKKRGHELFANFALGTISNEGTFLGGLIAFL